MFAGEAATGAGPISTGRQRRLSAIAALRGWASRQSILHSVEGASSSCLPRTPSLSYTEVR